MQAPAAPPARWAAGPARGQQIGALSTRHEALPLAACRRSAATPARCCRPPSGTHLEPLHSWGAAEASEPACQAARAQGSSKGDQGWVLPALRVTGNHSSRSPMSRPPPEPSVGGPSAVRSTGSPGPAGAHARQIAGRSSARGSLAAPFGRLAGSMRPMRRRLHFSLIGRCDRHQCKLFIIRIAAAAASMSVLEVLGLQVRALGSRLVILPLHKPGRLPITRPSCSGRPCVPAPRPLWCRPCALPSLAMPLLPATCCRAWSCWRMGRATRWSG